MTSEADDAIIGDEPECESENDNQSESIDRLRKGLDFSTLPLLVTGGAGYIGSHTVIELMKSGFTNIVIIDNYINSCCLAIDRVKIILNNELKAGRIKSFNLDTYNVDLANNDPTKLHKICSKHKFFACLHFAGLKAVGESVAKPLEYYHNNLNSTLNLLRVLPIHDCHNFIFSSSATVYGTEKSPITEQTDIGRGISNPYGFTKFFVEQILHDTAHANYDLNAVILRYFNPIGAHPSGLIGNDPRIPNNLMPYLLQVAVGRRKYLSVFGNDYDTEDGTGVRDYIHIVDIARGHVKALEMDIIPKHLRKELLRQNRINNDNNNNNNNINNNNNDIEKNYVSAYNLGTGKGSSVLQMIAALEKACGFTIPYKIMPRRAGDLDTLYADCTLAEKKLGWKAEYDINEACCDAWRWQKSNPMGYEDTKPKNVNVNSNNSNNDNNNKNEKIFNYRKIMTGSFVILIIAIVACFVLKAMNVHYENLI